MTIGTSIKSADGADIIVVSIAKREVFVDVHASREHKALPGADTNSPPEQFTLNPSTSLKFYSACAGQIDEEHVGNDGCSATHINPVVGMEVKVPVKSTLSRRGLRPGIKIKLGLNQLRNRDTNL